MKMTKYILGLILGLVGLVKADQIYIDLYVFNESHCDVGFYYRECVEDCFPLEFTVPAHQSTNIVFRVFEPGAWCLVYGPPSNPQGFGNQTFDEGMDATLTIEIQNAGPGEECGEISADEYYVIP